MCSGRAARKPSFLPLQAPIGNLPHAWNWHVTQKRTVRSDIHGPMITHPAYSMASAMFCCCQMLTLLLQQNSWYHIFKTNCYRKIWSCLTSSFACTSPFLPVPTKEWVTETGSGFLAVLQRLHWVVRLLPAIMWATDAGFDGLDVTRTHIWTRRHLVHSGQKRCYLNWKLLVRVLGQILRSLCSSKCTLLKS